MSPHEYLIKQIEFAVAVALFMEFDFEVPLRSEFPEPRSEENWDEIKAKTLKLAQPNYRDLKDYKKEIRVYDVSFACMEYAKEFRMSPIKIAEKIKPYVEQVYCIDRVEIIGGYLNIFFNRTQYFLDKLEWNNAKRNDTKLDATVSGSEGNP